MFISKINNEKRIVEYASYYKNQLESLIKNDVIKTNGVYDVLQNGNLCYEDKVEDNKCTDNKFEIEVDVSSNIPDWGKIIFANGKIDKIKLIYDRENVVNNRNGDMVLDKVKDSNIICEKTTYLTRTTGNVPTGKFLPGDEYICEVAQGEYYRFFVVSVNYSSKQNVTKNNMEEPVESVNLILDRNIYYDEKNDVGVLIDSDLILNQNTGFTKWSEQNNGNISYIAFTYLYNATKKWDNLEKISFEYKNKENYMGDFEIKKENNIIYIYDNHEKKVIETFENLKARFPLYNEIPNFPYGWAFNYMKKNNEPSNRRVINGTVEIDGIEGYWVLSLLDENYSQFVSYKGNIITKQNEINNIGVRPVINVDVSKIK